MAENLADRQAAILRAVVREYIRSGEPIGSKHLVDRTQIQVSSATVRNEMARLEDLGYLQQPHTSAGRIPTDRGYRFVVDEIKRPKPLAEGQRRALEEELGEETLSLEDMLRRASDAVSRLTRHAAAVLAQRAQPSAIRRVELFSTGSNMAMLVLIAENGRVEQRMLPHDRSLGAEDVESLGRSLAQALHGRGLQDAASWLDEQILASSSPRRELLEQVRAGVQALQDAEQHVVVHGAANLAGADFERDELYKLYDALEHQSAVLHLLASSVGQPVTVRIGAEVPAEGLSSCSIVVARFDAGQGGEGSVGVIGPTRMDYERVMAAANTVARLLETSFGSHDG